MLHAAAAARGADVVHVTGDVHFLTLLLPRRRTVLTIHDCEILDRNRGVKRFLLWLFWFRLPAWCAARITTVSAESRRRFLAWVGVDPSRVEVIENPLPRTLTRAVRSCNRERPCILLFGSAPHKNIDRTVAALAGLPVRIVIVGRIDDTRLRTLRRHEVPIDARHNLSDDELESVYRESDILVFTSLAEGFGLPILEAQAVGRPVVTSDRSPMREVAGEAALLVDPENSAAIRAAVARLMGDPALCARLVEAGFANAARYTPQTAAAAYAALYRRTHEAALCG
jgi:glycosyltransferase involved in cell wall biosynthesis